VDGAVGPTVGVSSSEGRGRVGAEGVGVRGGREAWTSAEASKWRKASSWKGAAAGEEVGESKAVAMAWALGIWILLATASLGVEMVVVGAAPDLS
jgi:hypothetical protein